MKIEEREIRPLKKEKREKYICFWVVKKNQSIPFFYIFLIK